MLFWRGIVGCVLGIGLWVLRLLSGYEWYRNSKIREYRRTLDALESGELLDDLSEEERSFVRSGVEANLAAEKESFTLAIPATLLIVVGAALVLKQAYANHTLLGRIGRRVAHD